LVVEDLSVVEGLEAISDKENVAPEIKTEAESAPEKK